jgi:hypothetical protein
MAARRERERRRPSAERSYRFASSEPALEEEAARTTANGEDATDAAKTTTDKETPSRRSRASRTATLATEPQSASTRGGVRTTRPFSEYAAEYAYVLTDLRRVALVIGSLLFLLILLYFALPLLPH